MPEHASTSGEEVMPKQPSWSRRKFLQAATLTVCGGLVIERCTSNAPTTDEQNATDGYALEVGQKNLPETRRSQGSSKHILVVGSGMAGVTAARELTQKGYPVIVLEGRNRTGGRIFTDNSLGFAAERGAQWIEGITGNPLTQLARDFNIPMQFTNFDDVQFFSARGKPSSPQELLQLERGFRQLERQIASYQGLEDTSVARLLKNIPSLTDEVRRCVALVTEDGSGAEVGQMSVKALQRAPEFQGGEHSLVSGYQSMIDKLTQGLDIRLGQTVKSIDTSQPQVVVQTQDKQMYQGAAVVVTVPLGILKASPNSQAGIAFTPALPEKKQKAIRESGFGLLNKVYLKFKKPFWSYDHPFLAILPSQDNDFCVFANHGHSHKQPVLTAFVASDFARELEALTDEQITQRMVKKLQLTYGQKVQSKGIEAVILTRWGKDPWSLGSYSYAAVNQYQWRDDLAAPVDNRLFFAGEACAAHNASVHGAHMSGLETARQIGKVIKL